ncbi:MAG: vitamin B12-dependent ribonucleotide reductase, partial [Vicinamibacteria bacterium]
MATTKKEISLAVESEPSERSLENESPGLRFDRYFTEKGVSPYDSVEWEIRDALIQDEKGEKIFEQKAVEVPKSWSQMATNIVSSKYFHGSLDTGERERSARQLVGRVVDTMTRWGVDGRYFASTEDAVTFRDELTFLLLNQHASFNSPVWFNCGIEKKPQCSACFINSVDDTMDSILSLAKTEGMLFKWGSGTGSNLSSIRSSKEQLSGGGIASGPVSFMKGYDAFAGVIRSGGKTRRAAKMVILNVDHPDIVEFIDCKLIEEQKAWTLIDAGYDGSFNGEAYASIFYQNANHSVRVTDEFMRAVEEDREWVTPAVTSGQPLGKHRARDLFRKIAVSTHVCGDPGMQFDTTINRWHTSKNTARINASNPCSEYMYLDDSACNLASFNLMKFLTPEGQFDVRAFRKAVDVVITAMEIIVGSASYPTEKIGRNSEAYRPLGIGYANLGALLMYQGIPYDSDRGRDTAAAITAVMT